MSVKGEREYSVNKQVFLDNSWNGQNLYRELSLLLGRENQISVLGFRMFFGEKEVYYGFLCSPDIANDISFSLDQERNLSVKYQLEPEISLGNLNLGGIRPWGYGGIGFKTRDIQGRDLGCGSRGRIIERFKKELRLEDRSLFADPIYREGNESVIVSGLMWQSDKRWLQVLKIVNTTRSDGARYLANEVKRIIKEEDKGE